MRGPLMPVSANRVWRELPNEIRVAICQTFWAESKGTEKQFLFASLARAKNLREVFVRKSPIERLVNWTATTLSLPDPIVDDLLKRYLLHEHRAVIVSFLDLLNIPHSEGMIEENFDYATLTNERVQEAARSLLTSADRTGSDFTLNTSFFKVDPGLGLKKSCQPESKSRWQVVHFILGGTGVLQDWEYGNYDVSDWPVLSSVP